MSGSTRKLKKNLKIHGNKWKRKHNCSEPLGCNKGGPKREVYNNTDLSQEARKVLNIQPNLTPKGAGERTANKA